MAVIFLITGDYTPSSPGQSISRGKLQGVSSWSLRPGIAPQAILDSRRKVGFNAPIASFLNLKDPETRAQILDDGSIFDYVKREPIAELVDKDSLPNSQSKFLFYFLNCRIFLDEWAA